MLVKVGNYSPHWYAFEMNTGGLNRRQVRAAVKKIRNAADLMRRTRWLLHTKDLSPKDHLLLEGPEPISPETLDEFRGLPKSVLHFAERLERALRRPEFSPHKHTIQDAALLMLLVYLNRVTRQYRDSAVCELLRAGLKIRIDESALNQWRYRYRKKLEAKLNFKPHRST
jgi:hypothetical protein